MKKVSKDEMRGVEYQAWRNMMAKCYDTRHPEFKSHGGKGIQVWQRWHDYENFLEDMGRSPKYSH